MATAPLSAGWRWPLANTPGPWGAPVVMGGDTLPGVPFLDGIPAFATLYPNARLMVQVAWGADLTGDPSAWSWTDVSADVLQANGATINITPMGRSDASQLTQPAGLSFRLDNRSGNYSRGAQSANYPNVKLNVPVRVSINLTGVPNDTQTRFLGGGWSFKPSWDPTGNYAVIDVQAAGVMRRLQQGKTPLKSPLYRATTSTPPLAYWRLEDPASSTVGASGVESGLPMIQTVGTSAPWSQIDGPTGGDGSPTPDFRVNVQMTGQIAAATSTGELAFGMAFLLDSAQTSVNPTLGHTLIGQLLMSDGTSLTIDIGDIDYPYFMGGARDSTGASTGGVFDDFSVSDLYDGTWHYVLLTAVQDGSSIDLELFYDGRSLGTTSVTGTLKAAARVVLNTHNATIASSFVNDPESVAHVAVWDTVDLPDLASAVDGYLGETVTDRMVRLCTEQDVPLSITGTSTKTMGPQTVATFMALMRECEAVDQGILGDGLSPGLYYITNSSRYNQTAGLSLSATAADVVPDFQPADDDQRVLNSWQVTRTNGATVVAEDTDGPVGTDEIGTYDSSLTVNTETDTMLPVIASWLVHLGTVEGYRYPTLTLDFTRRPAQAPAWLALGINGHIALTSVYSWIPQHPHETVDLLAEGWTEQLSRFVWRAVVNCSPQSPYEVMELDSGSGNESRLDSDTAVLTAPGITAAFTGFDVTTTGAQWIDSAGYASQFPFDIMIEGERMTVTAITGTVSPQTFTVTRAVNGISAPHPTGAEVHLFNPVVLAL